MITGAAARDFLKKDGPPRRVTERRRKRNM